MVKYMNFPATYGPRGMNTLPVTMPLSKIAPNAVISRHQKMALLRMLEQLSFPITVIAVAHHTTKYSHLTLYFTPYESIRVMEISQYSNIISDEDIPHYGSTGLIITSDHVTINGTIPLDDGGFSTPLPPNTRTMIHQLPDMSLIAIPDQITSLLFLAADL